VNAALSLDSEYSLVEQDALGVRGKPLPADRRVGIPSGGIFPVGKTSFSSAGGNSGTSELI
jgi:hypothetical protein